MDEEIRHAHKALIRSPSSRNCCCPECVYDRQNHRPTPRPRYQRVRRGSAFTIGQFVVVLIAVGFLFQYWQLALLFITAVLLTWTWQRTHDRPKPAASKPQPQQTPVRLGMHVVHVAANPRLPDCIKGCVVEPTAADLATKHQAYGDDLVLVQWFVLPIARHRYWEPRAQVKTYGDWKDPS